MELWEAQPVGATSVAEAGSQDERDLGGLGGLNATGAASESATGVTIGPGLVQAGTGVASGVDNGTNRDSQNTDDPEIGGSGLHSATAGDALKPPDCGVTGPCLVQEGTGATTGGGTGLDWVLSDGDEEEVESALLQKTLEGNQWRVSRRRKQLRHLCRLSWCTWVM